MTTSLNRPFEAAPLDERSAWSMEELTHEVRTPLASIRSLSEILRDYPDLSERERHLFLRAVIEENERLSRTLERLLATPQVQSLAAEA